MTFLPSPTEARQVEICAFCTFDISMHCVFPVGQSSLKFLTGADRRDLTSFDEGWRPGEELGFLQDQKIFLYTALINIQSSCIYIFRKVLTQYRVT